MPYHAEVEKGLSGLLLPTILWGLRFSPGGSKLAFSHLK